MIIIATCYESPAINTGLRVLVDSLTKQGSRVRCIPWQAINPDELKTTDKVLPLCAWDYAKSAEVFANWITQISQSPATLLNSAETILWNMRKDYLLSFAKKGLNITPTRYLEKPDVELIHKVMVQENWQDAVIKPAFGQSGHNVMRYSPTSIKNEFANQDNIHQSGGGILIQPFIQEVEQYGELALCFIDGEYSHAVCRMPAIDDWRANTQYNVAVSKTEPEQRIIHQAQRFIDTLDEIPLYARVDGFVVNRQFMLSELELIEPALFFDRMEDLGKTGFSRLLNLLALP